MPDIGNQIRVSQKYNHKNTYCEVVQIVSVQLTVW